MNHPGRSLFLLLILTYCQHMALAQDSMQTKFAFVPNFGGENCDAIAEDLKKQRVGKDEFETSAAYTARIQSVLNSSVVAGRSLAEPRFFVNADEISTAYNADKGVLKVYRPLRKSIRVSGDNKDAGFVVVKKRSMETSEYEAANGFGATTVVRRYQEDVCGIAFLNASPATDPNWLGSIDVPLSADAARLSKDKISLVYLARLTPPLLVSYGHRTVPTISAPSEFVVTGDALTAALEKLFVINRATGEVMFERVYSPR